MNILSGSIYCFTQGVSPAKRGFTTISPNNPTMTF